MKIEIVRWLSTVVLLGDLSWGQVSWQSTHTTTGGYQNGLCELTRASLRVKVYPAYLDVEEDVEMAPVGQIRAGVDAKTLEITGAFSLPAGGAITGALLWDGASILEGKLLDRKTADSLYANLVDRNSTPPPRPKDPLLLEATGNDTYRFKIYPSEPGKTRHLRLRYQLAPTIGVQGLDIALMAALTPLFAGAKIQVPVNIESGGVVAKIIFSEGGDIRTEMSLPRTRLMNPGDLGAGGYVYDSWGNVQYDYMGNVLYQPGIHILPVDPERQVMVKTSFASGTMQGNYLNLYAGVTDQVLSGLRQRVELVVYWKWHNPGTWLIKSTYGEYFSDAVYQAQNQAATIAGLFGQFGGQGTKIGLLHDDSRTNPRIFKAASRNEPAYIQAQEYLRTVQEGSYVSDFVRGIKVLRNDKKQPLTASQAISKERFFNNMRLVKTLFSPDSGIVRHILVISAGDDYLSEDNDMNAKIDSLFEDQPITLAGVGGAAFNQVGFDFFDARRVHAYQGPTAWTPWGDMPSLPAINLNLVVRNAKKAYDFSVACSGGLDITCGSLTFHGKSDEIWNDTLEWQSFDKFGKSVAITHSVPKVIEAAGDTATAILWAASVAPFSEKKELPLGPIYGFVDAWASLLSLPKDSLNPDNSVAYGDTGVPHISNTALNDVIPNYADNQAPNYNNPTGVNAFSFADKFGALSKPESWKFERGHGNLLLVRIPGMAQGLEALVELYGLDGKRAGFWTKSSDLGSFTLNLADVHPGMYFLKIQVSGHQGVKRLTL